MRNILTGMILGALLACASLWILGYFPTKDKSGPAAEFDELMRKFPNKTLTYWSEDASTELYLYGRIALMKSMKPDSPRKEFGYDEAQAIWDQFDRLPGLQEFKNPDPDTVRPRSTHSVVFVDNRAGLSISPQFSYSIPKDEKREEYVAWRNLVETTIRTHLSKSDPG